MSQEDINLPFPFPLPGRPCSVWRQRIRYSRSSSPSTVCCWTRMWRELKLLKDTHTCTYAHTHALSESTRVTIQSPLQSHNQNNVQTPNLSVSLKRRPIDIPPVLHPKLQQKQSLAAHPLCERASQKQWWMTPLSRLSCGRREHAAPPKALLPAV